MLKQSLTRTLLVLQFLLVIMVSACSKGSTHPTTDPDPGGGDPDPDPPHTSVPAAFAGTWYPADNAQPMTIDWEKGTFQGQAGYKDFRTVIFTESGLDAVEYSSEVFVNGSNTIKQMYRITGTLEYSANPSKLEFHAVKGRIRVFTGSTYTESDILASDIAKYYSVLTDLVATTDVLNAKRFDGGNSFSVKYLRAGSDGGSDEPDEDVYSHPPATGTYVKIGNQYFPTVKIGNLEWTSVNYYGAGGINLPGKVHYGTFYRFTDLNQVPVPAGWRIATQQDYKDLLASQNIPFDPVWNTTDGSDLDSKKKLGRLMSATGWLKQDGYENNATGFNAVPANIQVASGSPNGEGTNCVLWTSEKDSEDLPVAFKIIQMPSDTYAAFSSYQQGYNPVYAPVRLVRNK